MGNTAPDDCPKDTLHGKRVSHNSNSELRGTRNPLKKRSMGWFCVSHNSNSEIRETRFLIIRIPLKKNRPKFQTMGTAISVEKLHSA
eukprot:1799304-Pyramimonas_sp.AAC.1